MRLFYVSHRLPRITMDGSWALFILIATSLFPVIHAEWPPHVSRPYGKGLKSLRKLISICRCFAMRRWGILRGLSKFGKPLGHHFGVFSNRILNYADARRYIYIPSYKYVLDNIPEVHRIIEKIREKANESDIVLLDYNLNPDNRDITKPLSHAELVKMYIEDRYPSRDEPCKKWI